MEKILIRDNADQAEAFIQKLDSELMPAVISVSLGLKNLGLEIDKIEFLNDIIKGEYVELNSRYLKIIEPDIEALSSPVAKSQLQKSLEKNLLDFLVNTRNLFEKNFDHRNLNDDEILAFVSLDEAGNPTITEKAREDIRESFKEYLDSEKNKKVYDAQQALAKDLEKFLNACVNAKHSRAFSIAPWASIINLFQIEVTEAGKYKVTTSDLNFSYDDDDNEIEIIAKDSSMEKKEAKMINISKAAGRHVAIK